MSNKKISYIAIASIVLITLAIIARYSPGVTQLIWSISSGGKELFPLVSITALIDSINPCAFSILILTIAFLFSIGTFSRTKILQIGAVYIFGIFVAYISIGLGIMSALHLFNTPHFMGKVGSALLIIMGIINLINYIWPSFPIKLQIPKSAHNKIADLIGKTSLAAVFLLGLLVGLCEFPCTGGPYLMIIGFLHDAKTKYFGLAYLFWYNILFVLPLVAVLFLASEESVLRKLENWKANNLGAMRLISGLIMLALGIIIFYF